MKCLIFSALVCFNVMFKDDYLWANSDIIANACLEAQRISVGIAATRRQSGPTLALQRLTISRLLDRSLNPGGTVPDSIYDQLMLLISSYLDRQGRPYKIEGRELFLEPHSSSTLGRQAQVLAKAKIPARLGLNLKAFLTENFLGYLRVDTYDIIVPPLTIIDDEFTYIFEHEFSHWLTEYKFLVEGKSDADQIELRLEDEQVDASNLFTYAHGSSLSEYGAMLAELVHATRIVSHLLAHNPVHVQKHPHDFDDVVEHLADLRHIKRDVFYGHMEALDKIKAPDTQLTTRNLKRARDFPIRIARDEFPE